MDILNKCAYSSMLDGTSRQSSFFPEPRGRGTVGLLWSCIVTFGICVWTTVHPNIPLRKTTSWDRKLYKLILMLVAAFVPEVLMICSFGEWREAKKLHRFWCEHFNITEGSDEDRMGIEGGFFVLMGGLCVGGFTLNEGGKEHHYTSTLTPRGFRNFVRNGQIDKRAFHRRDIIDKGKANNLAKLLVALQTSWFIVQCIARKVSCLPVTLLEIHVGIQVVCAVVSFAFWWRKPLDVDEPFKITIHQYSSPTTEFPMETESRIFKEYDVVTEQTRSGFLRLAVKACYDLLAFSGGRGHKNRSMFLVGVLIIFNSACHLVAWNNYFPSALEHFLWKTSSLAICVGALIYALIASTGGYEKRLLCTIWEMRFYEKGSLWKYLWIRLRKEREYMSMGGDQELHESDYEDEIPGLPFSGNHHTRAKYETITPQPSSRLTYFLRRCLFDLTWLLAGVYFLCMLFLTVESFISMRDLPEGSYVTPAWIDYWPH